MTFFFSRLALRRLAWIWLPLLMLAAGHSSARALCELPSVSSSMVSGLSGTLGARVPVRMMLDFKPFGRVEGRYAYASSFSDIRVAGKLSGGVRLQLTEYDAGGAPRATFDGIFSGTQNSGDRVECNQLSGQWKDLRNGKSRPFQLTLEDIQAGPLDHLYRVAGVTDDDTVNLTAGAFRRGVLEDRRDVVAQSMQYPLHVNLGGKPLVLNSPKDLLAHYNRIFTDAYVHAIGQAVPRLMFARYDGVMLGNGEVWFGANGKVIALNR